MEFIEINLEDMAPPYRVEFLTPHAPTIGVIPACCARHAFKAMADLRQVDGIQIKIIKQGGLQIAEATDMGIDFIIPDYETAFEGSE